MLHHEGYSGSGAPSYDVALIYLEEPLEHNEYVTAACIPTSDHEGTKAIVSGWGHTVEGNNIIGDILSIMQWHIVWLISRYSGPFLRNVMNTID